MAPDTPLEVSYNAALADQCKRWIMRDADGVAIIDYAGPAVREVLSTWDGLGESLAKAREFAHRQWEHFIANGDRKLALRYSRLEGHLNSRERLARPESTNHPGGS